MQDDLNAWWTEIATVTGPGPATTVAVVSDGRELQRIDVAGHVPERCDRIAIIVARCLRLRPSAIVELVARDASGTIVDRYAASAVSPATLSPVAAPSVPLERVLEAALVTGREYSRIGIEAADRAAKTVQGLADRIVSENDRLRTRIDQLEERLTETFELRENLRDQLAARRIEEAEAELQAEERSKLLEVGAGAVRALVSNFGPKHGASADAQTVGAIRSLFAQLRPAQLESILGTLDEGQRLELLAVASKLQEGSERGDEEKGKQDQEQERQDVG